MNRSVSRVADRVGARRRGAAVLIVLGWTAWLHYWVPAALLLGLVAWLVLHRHGDVVRRRWQRAWPPGPRVLAALLGAGMLTFLAYDAPPVTKVMPIALHVLALSVLLFGTWWSSLLAALPWWLGGDYDEAPVTGHRAVVRAIGARV
jgi:hypothetical protein